ncbi:MAG: hypothetical protein KGI38_01760 [Thaumarchaeota archaeon]|nr:hypothetical protein [Nitrososphaerota archaeon]
MGPLDDPVEEAKRIIDTAEGSKITVRLLGGIAFHFRCPSAASTSLQRAYVDIDYMAYAKQSKDLRRLFPELGYVAREKFNAMMGDKRLIFNDLDHQRRVDIFLDVFEMCHRFSFKDRLQLERYTIPLADLLATKLQIVEINQKDLRDITSMFVDHPVGGSGDPEAIDGPAIARLCGDDWGVYRTFTMNLDKLPPVIESFGLGGEARTTATRRVQELRSLIEEAPKNLRWRMRARVGDKVKWYELPEADREVVDSRQIQAGVSSAVPQGES